MCMVRGAWERMGYMCMLSHSVMSNSVQPHDSSGGLIVHFISIKKLSFSFHYEMSEEFSNLSYNKVISFFCGLPSSAHCLHSIFNWVIMFFISVQSFLISDCSVFIIAYFCVINIISSQILLRIQIRSF